MNTDTRQLPLDFDQPARATRVEEAQAIIDALFAETEPGQVIGHERRLLALLRPDRDGADLVHALGECAVRAISGHPASEHFRAAVLHDVLLYTDPRYPGRKGM